MCPEAKWADRANPTAATESDPASPRLLVVDDDESMRRAIVRMFHDGYAVFEAPDGVKGLKRALDVRPDVIITDQRMPGKTGVELLCDVKQELPKTIRILATGYDDYGPMVDAVNAAEVHHYFEKPFHSKDLRKVVDTLVRNAELEAHRDQLLAELSESVKKLAETNRQLLEKEARLTELVEARTAELKKSNEQLQAANEQLREMAVRDGLTNLFNYRYLVEHLELEVARSSRYDRTFCVLFIDIDDFKQVNDSHGHQTGDAVLRAVADLLRGGAHALRSSDVSARYGGEEFCLVLPETPLPGGEIKADRLRQALEQSQWTEQGLPAEQRITVSVGVACFPDHGTTRDALLNAADTAVYQAKRLGKNRVVTYERS